MKRVLVVGSLMLSFFCHSQNEEIDLEDFAERLFQVQDENITYEDIYESLLLLYANKLNLNKVDPEELASVYLLSPSQLNSFFDYRGAYGPLLSIHELQVIPGFDVNIIRSLRPFVAVDETAPDTRPFHQRVMEEENNYLLLRYTRRLEPQVGYTVALPLDTTFVKDENDTLIDTLTSPPTRYRGSPDKLYARFRTSHKDDFSIGFTFEKDAGERFEFSNGQNGFDFYSYHLLLENKWGFKDIMLGDYQLQVGQGIVFGAGFNAGKGAETVATAKRNSIGLRPYTSVLESGFFKGVGITKKMGNFELTGFHSNLKQDGNILMDTTFSDFTAYVNSIQNSGFHRTTSELAVKDQIDEVSTGGVIEYKPNRRLTIGISGINTSFSTPLQRRPNNYNQFEFKGDHNYITSSHFYYTWQNFTFFGEGARSKSGGVGAVGGFVSSLSPKVDMAIILRNYDRNFHSFYGNAFSENSRNINEHGTYWGLSISPNRRHKLNVYYDSFTFPWLKYGTDAPSIGNEWLARYTHKPSRQIVLYIQARQQLKQVTIPEGNLNVLSDQLKHNYIFNVDYELKSNLKFKTKIQSSTQHEGDEFTKGFVILQDVNFDVWKLKFHTRVALFDTDNFDNAQYVYENDVLYAFSIPAYNGKGVRNYVMVRYDPMKNVSLWVRYSSFTFQDREVIGSGLEEANGDRSSEIKMMARIKF